LLLLFFIFFYTPHTKDTCYYYCITIY